MRWRRGHAGDVVASIDLVTLATELLGKPKGAGRSAKWPSPVPGHIQTGQTPPMGIFVGNDGKQRWQCFATGHGGDAIDLVVTVTGDSWEAAYRSLAERVPLRRSLRPAPTGGSAAKTTLDIDTLQGWVARCVAARGDTMHEWLVSHGIKPEWARAHQVGWAQGQVPALQHRVGGGVVLPAHGVDGYLVGANVRLFGRGAKYLAITGDGWDGLNFVRPTTRRRRDVVAVAEGSIDAIALAETAGVATIGTSSAAVSRSSIERIAAVAAGRPVAVAFDDDAAGNRAADLVLATVPVSFRVELGGGDVCDAVAAGRDLERAIATGPWTATQSRVGMQL